MPPDPKEVRQFSIFLYLSGLTYLAVGFAFAIIPGPIVKALNDISRTVAPGLPLAPIDNGKFWLALTFSMMMTISALAFLSARRPIENRRCVSALLISKACSTLCGLAFFIWAERCLAYLAITLIDGSIFLVTLLLYSRASLANSIAWAEFYTSGRKPRKETPPADVYIDEDKDLGKPKDDNPRTDEEYCRRKIALLDRVLASSGFFEVLERERAASRKPKDEFRVVIKPNFMFCHHRKDFTTYTDPDLVEHLIDRIRAAGFTNVTLVEAQSTLGNYYTNREVLTVAEYLGYKPDGRYQIVDLTEEKVRYDYGGRLGWHWVGPTWRDADFRVSFAKNKTHVFCHYTLTLKNVYGCLPLQDKLRAYHTTREYDWATIETLKHFPVHFGLIDATISGDGQFGVIVCPHAKYTSTLIAGENLIAVDWVGAAKMGLNPGDPRIGRFVPLAIRAFGKPKAINAHGSTERYHPWENVDQFFIDSLDIIEEAAAFSDWWFCSLTAMDGFFAPRPLPWHEKLMRAILAPIKRIYYRHDRVRDAVREARGDIGDREIL